MYLKKFKCQDVLEINAEGNEAELLNAYRCVQTRLNEVYSQLFWDSM